MKAKEVQPWPTPGQRRLVSDDEITRHLGISLSTWLRLSGRPGAVRLGPRSKKTWSDAVDAFVAGLPVIGAE